MSPDELHIKLKKDVFLKVQESLETIFDVCQEQQYRGIFDFSIATVDVKSITYKS